MISNLVRCPAYDMDVIIRCFKEVPLDEFMKAHQEIVEVGENWYQVKLYFSTIFPLEIPKWKLMNILGLTYFY